MNNPSLNRIRHNLQIWHWREQAIAFAIVIAIFCITGPFQTYALPFNQRLLFWLLCISAGWIAIIAMVTLTLRHPRLDNWPASYRLALAIAIAVGPTTAAVWGVEHWIRPSPDDHSILRLFLNTSVVCILIGTALFIRVQSRLGRTGSIAPAENISPAAPFLDRLPYHLGETLILMRLQDAIDEMGALQGIQIHRSHGITAEAFRGLKRDNGRLVAKLSDGRTLPVSRTYAPTVRGFS